MSEKTRLQLHIAEQYGYLQQDKKTEGVGLVGIGGSSMGTINNINNNGLSPSSSSQLNQLNYRPLITVSNIQPRSMKPQRQQNEQIKRVKDEIDRAAKERDRRIKQYQNNHKTTPNSTIDSQSPYITSLMAHIQQYNAIIEHKHLINKDSEEARKILRVKDKSNVQKIAGTICNCG